MKKRNKICVAEDNEVLLNRLVDALSIDYDVYAAYNGFDAFQVIKETIPDLIISDIMMPELDGFQLLKIVQSDKKLRKIPFILLTALSDEENILNGYQNGAFDYITKPFSMKILLVKVANIFSRDEITTIVENKQTDPLILKINEYLNSNIQSPNIYITEIAEQVNLTIQQLNRRMIKFTGMSTSNYILNQRLEYSKKLLTLQSYTVNEVATKSGFTSSSYFIKMFKRKYKDTPSDMRSKIVSPSSN
jgi:YesN/AraC family two-component response regulator